MKRIDSKLNMRTVILPGVLATMLLSISFTSCDRDNNKPDEPGAGGVCRKKTVLLYAVASNNLYDNLLDDKVEMLSAASGMDLEGVSMLVYEVTRYGNPVLSEIVRTPSGECVFEVVKEYDKEYYSTDPRRITQVVSDMVQERDAESYGLIFWSHGTGIDPSFSTHATRGDGVVERPIPGVYSFGSDNDKDKNPSYYDEIDIDELADAIPEGLFSFIWFDACYMAGIETAYEFRDKCDYFVGYPTEVFTPGMPYDLTLPYILREESDLVGAAQQFFRYYSEHPSSGYRVATISVLSERQIEAVAECCKAAYSGVESAVGTVGLQCYSRGRIGPFYDFGQYTERMAVLGQETPDMSDFNKAMTEFVIWSAATPQDFNYRPIPEENYSGVSCHVFDATSNTDKSNYYKTLDWYKRVYAK